MTDFDCIIALVTRHYGITKRDLISKQRSVKLCFPRHIVMYLAAHYTPHSLPTIGRKLGDRDHTTVLHGKQKIERLIFEDDDVRCQLQAFAAQILTGFADEDIVIEDLLAEEPIFEQAVTQQLIVAHHKAFTELLAASKAVTQTWCALSSFTSPIARANTLPRFQKAMKDLQNLTYQPSLN